MASHDHGHAHRHDDVSGRRLAIAAGINVAFAVVQIAVGLAIGAIVVLADALHQAVDAIGLVTALVATRLARRGPTGSMSFGWAKSDALGAYTSSLLLLASVAWVVWEAIDRLRHPVEIAGGGVIAIGLAGIAVNGVSVWLLGQGGHLAVRAARLHLLVDLAGSVIVVVTGALLVGTAWTWIDPVASLLVNALVIRGAIGLMRAATGELLDRAPSGVAPDDVVRVVGGLPGVTDVHHVHSRSLGTGQSSITAHVVVDGALSVHDAQRELDSIQHALVDELGVEHATIQLECHECDDAEHLVAPSGGERAEEHH